MSTRRKLDLEFLEVIDLSIVGQDQSSVPRLHRLARGIRQIDDRQPAMAEPDRAIAIMSLAVRTPMGDDIGHRSQRRDRRWSPIAMENAGYATHVNLGPIPAAAQICALARRCST